MPRTPIARRPLPSTPRLAAALTVALTVATLAGCSSGGSKATSATPAPGAEKSAGQSAPAPADSPLGVTAGGVTTRMEVPAESTEEQYAQACLTAKDWMGAKGGDAHSLIEPYLAEIQKSGEASRATFGKTWAQLSDPQRAGVLIAVRAAADGGC